ncbi:MAG: hypothetical protein OEW58_10445 [Gammaproteobacteria bacterium]|nr:hypothetical protein [Gammaproteobacteria bacterium]
MSLPLQIIYRYVEPQTALDESIFRRVDGFEQLYAEIVSCRVMVEASEQPWQKDDKCRVVIDVILLSESLQIVLEASGRHGSEAMMALVQRAFDDMQCRLSVRRTVTAVLDSETS